MYCDYRIAEEQRFIGGSKQQYIFPLTERNGNPQNLEGATVKFILADFTDTSRVVLVKKAEIQGNLAVVTLESSDTVGLKGTFVFQLEVYLTETDIFIPITGNIEIDGRNGGVSR